MSWGKNGDTNGTYGLNGIFRQKTLRLLNHLWTWNHDPWKTWGPNLYSVFMVIFHSHVELPQGKQPEWEYEPRICWWYSIGWDMSSELGPVLASGKWKENTIHISTWLGPSMLGISYATNHSGIGPSRPQKTKKDQHKQNIFGTLPWPQTWLIVKFGTLMGGGLVPSRILLLIVTVTIRRTVPSGKLTWLWTIPIYVMI